MSFLRRIQRAFSVRSTAVVAPGNVAPVGEASPPDDADGQGAQPEPPPALAANYVGYLAERSGRHVAGWVYDPGRPGHRVSVEVYLPDATGEQVVATGMADLYNRVLSMLAIDDAIHAFRIHLPEMLDEESAARLEVRPVGAALPLPHDPKLRNRWEPITHVALDIVDNCNLRCPFCLYDYTGVNKTNVMSKGMFAQAIRLLPLVGPGHFWLSCLHEPTLHPDILELIEMIPTEFRSNVFFTTNLAKRMPEAYFEKIAGSGLDHINISVESLDPAIYERMRKGARHRIFMENWDKLLAAFARQGDSAPKLRYIAMAYRSNEAELPGLVAHLLDERRGWNVEVRDTYDVKHLPPAFRKAEFLDINGWRRLYRALSAYPVQKVQLSLPAGFTPDDVSADAAAPSAPEPSASHEPNSAGAGALLSSSPTDYIAAARRVPIPGLFEVRLSWNGDMSVMPALAGDYPNQRDDTIYTNIDDLSDPAEYIRALCLSAGA